MQREYRAGHWNIYSAEGVCVCVCVLKRTYVFACFHWKTKASINKAFKVIRRVIESVSKNKS